MATSSLKKKFVITSKTEASNLAKIACRLDFKNL